MAMVSTPSTVAQTPAPNLATDLAEVLPEIEAHPHARAVLGSAITPNGKGKPSHAYLLHGPAGSGKRAIARAFAGALLADGALGEEA